MSEAVRTAVSDPHEAAPREGARRARILLVDDRPENLFALEAILEPLGHDLVRAASGEEALRHVLLSDFACILLDVQMPGMNGFETAQMIKSRERSRFTPIIFLTAISKDDEFVYEGYSVGAVDYLSKPFNPDVLRSKVGVFVDLYLKNEQLKEQEQRLREGERRELELRHREQLLESERRLAEIVGSAMEAIMTFGEDRRITLFNAAAERMFGVRREQALARTVDELFHADFRGAEMDRICAEATRARAGRGEADPAFHGADAPAPERPRRGRASREPAPRSLSITGVRASGEEFPVEASVSCLEQGGERIFTVIARDVSERRRAEEALRQQAISLARATAELQEVNEQLQARQMELEAAMSARSRFYASMSHELRTPINAILGYSSLLLDDIYGPLNPEQAKGIDRANKAAKHLLELVNDILDLSKIEAGKVELEIQPAIFPGLIQDLFVTVRPMADEHGTELALHYDAEPVTLITDPRRVRQILLNLFSNAIKFGQGQPIDVRCTPREDGGIVVDVVDRGPGIPPDDLDRIFDEFVQLSQPNQHQGTGLGLPISRRLATLLDGSLEAFSTQGEGSTFRLTLPSRVSDTSFRPETGEFGGHKRPSLGPQAASLAALAERSFDAPGSDDDSDDDSGDSDDSDALEASAAHPAADATQGLDTASSGDALLTAEASAPDGESSAEDATADASSPDAASEDASSSADASPHDGEPASEGAQEESESERGPEESAGAAEEASGAGGASGEERGGGDGPSEEEDSEERWAAGARGWKQP